MAGQAYLYALQNILTMRWLIIVLVSMLPSALRAQGAYRPIPTADVGWLEQHAWKQPGTVSSEYEWRSCTDRIVVDGTIFLNDLEYARLRIRRYCSVQPIGGTFDTSAYFSYHVPWQDLLYFREDTMARKVYAVLPSQGDAEQLLFDMTMELGTYPVTAFSPLMDEPYLFVVAVDSVELSDGWHRRWRIADGDDPVPFTDLIEGVGLTAGWNLVWEMLRAPFEWTNDLECHTVQNVPIYSVPGTSCLITMDVENAVSSRPWQAWPVPAQDQIHVSGPTEQIFQYRVLDQSGRTVSGGRWEQGALDCSGWAKGWYVLELVGAGEQKLGYLRIVTE
jgi:hypothetical protein